MWNRHLVSAALFLIVLGVPSTRAAEPTEAKARLQVPDQAAQEKALALVREVYREDFASAKTLPQKHALFEKLLNVGNATQNDPAGRFVLWQLARDGAAQAGDVELAFKVIDALSKTYAVELLPMQVKSLDGAVKSNASPAQFETITKATLSAIDLAVAKDNYDTAQSLTELAVSASRNSRNPELVKEVPRRAQEVEHLAQAFPEVKAALRTLDVSPADPAANLIVGKFYCFLKQDWKRGTPYLALGGEQTFQTLAAQELSAVTTSEAKLKLADEWWDVGEKERGDVRENVRRHAAAWYWAALPGLSGLAKARSEKRIAEVPSPTGISPALLLSPPRGPDKLLTNSIGMKLAYIPPGEFEMGSPENEANRKSNEVRQHVKIACGYYLGITEVTQSQWQAIMQSQPWKGQPRVKDGSTYPATFVSWYDAEEFCKRLGAKEKKTYRLPTEPEWEYACRAGSQSAYCFGNDVRLLSDFAWWGGKIGGGNAKTELYPHAVAQKKANGFGLYDMHGNVWEWCSDWYEGQLGRAASLSSEDTRPMRGGSWYHNSDAARSAVRDSNARTSRGDSHGFRVVLSVSPFEEFSNVSAGAGSSSSALLSQINPAQIVTPKSLENSIGMKLAYIPPGKFEMGSPESEKNRRSDETLHQVKLTNGFYLGTTEVTQGQWKTILKSEPWKGKANVKEGASCAASWVSWDDAQEFCKRLSDKEKKAYRLPTEAEWEYACRAGSQSVYSFGNFVNRLDDYAWWGGQHGEGNAKSEMYTHEVAQKKANGFGLYDMHGNVWEWCYDWYDEKYYADGAIDPGGPSFGTKRVLRGGSWLADGENIRTARRAGYAPDYRRNDFGFRVVLSPGTP